MTKIFKKLYIILLGDTPGFHDYKCLVVMVSIKTIMKETAVRVLGTKKKNKRRKWWNSECAVVVEERRKYRILSEQDSRHTEKHLELRSKAKQVIKKSKRQHLDGIVRNMECLIKANESRKFYQELRMQKKAYCD